MDVIDVDLFLRLCEYCLHCEYLHVACYWLVGTAIGTIIGSAWVATGRE